MKPGTLCRHVPTGMVLVISSEMTNLDPSQTTVLAMPCDDDASYYPFGVRLDTSIGELYAHPFLCGPYRKDELEPLDAEPVETQDVVTALFRIFRQD